MPGKLYLLPNLLIETADAASFLPSSVGHAVHEIQGLIAESEKSARRYLRLFLTHDEMVKIPLQLLNEHTENVSALLQPIERGETWGLISDAGLPCIADPGADLVWQAHGKNISLQTFVGPSSLIMALQLSGFSGQHFCFHGYLPRDVDALERKVKELEKAPGTQIWIEAPYRSQKMLDMLKKTLHPTTKLCIAVQLTAENQRVISQPIAKWRQIDITLGKEPAVYLISGSSHSNG